MCFVQLILCHFNCRIFSIKFLGDRIVVLFDSGSSVESYLKIILSLINARVANYRCFF